MLRITLLRTPLRVQTTRLLLTNHQLCRNYTIKETLENLNKEIGRAASSGLENIENMAHKVEDMASHLTDDVTKAGKTSFDENLKQAGDKAKEAWNQASGGVNENLNQAKEELKNQFDAKTKDFEEAKNTAKSQSEKVKDGWNQVTNTAKEKFNQTTEELKDQFNGKANDLAEEHKETLNEAKEKAKAKWEEVKGDAKGKREDVKDQSKKHID